ncbi:hypothetical protein ZIOFF_047881 [Zingiber officinale]|uniref:Uncharacterized protein n=1 Tax=Zingiber officinale TaxID=94328 RepID=A0A8J5G6V9_ZINOF|nr:hypothetical protein ZIOFF_047881 [Zingiber officinale]
MREAVDLLDPNPVMRREIGIHKRQLGLGSKRKKARERETTALLQETTLVWHSEALKNRHQGEVIDLRAVVGDLAVAVPFVCKSWYRASLDPSCWRRLNFRSLDFTPWIPFSRAFALRYRLHSPLSFSAFLRFALHRSHGVVDQLAFPLSSAVSIHDLAYASVKCLRLKALALPDNLMLEDDLRIHELVWRWKDLEHLEMETKPSSFLEAVAEIGRNCPRFVGLKVRGLIRREDAKALARCLPELKHLELSKSYLTKDELLVVIGGCRKLETLTVKDCLGFQADDEILKLVSRIKRFEHEGSTLVYSYTCSNIGSRSALQIILSFCLSFFNFNDKENSQSDDLVSIFSDVAGDVTIYVDGQSFLLHKFPLVSRSGKIWKMVVESREPDLIPVVSNIEPANLGELT